MSAKLPALVMSLYTVLGEPLTVHSLHHGKYNITEGDCAFLLLGKSRTTCLCVRMHYITLGHTVYSTYAQLTFYMLVPQQVYIFNVL